MNLRFIFSTGGRVHPFHAHCFRTASLAFSVVSKRRFFVFVSEHGSSIGIHLLPTFFHIAYQEKNSARSGLWTNCAACMSVVHTALDFSRDAHLHHCVKHEKSHHRANEALCFCHCFPLFHNDQNLTENERIGNAEHKVIPEIPHKRKQFFLRSRRGEIEPQWPLEPTWLRLGNHDCRVVFFCCVEQPTNALGTHFACISVSRTWVFLSVCF